MKDARRKEKLLSLAEFLGHCSATGLLGTRGRELGDTHRRDEAASNASQLPAKTTPRGPDDIAIQRNPAKRVASRRGATEQGIGSGCSAGSGFSKREEAFAVIITLEGWMDPLTVAGLS